jgi:hypothetical protein
MKVFMTSADSHLEGSQTFLVTIARHEINI